MVRQAPAALGGREPGVVGGGGGAAAGSPEGRGGEARERQHRVPQDPPRAEIYASESEVEIICPDCEKDARTVDGPLYPCGRGFLCADCGEKEEANYWNKAIVERDGGVS